MSLTPTQSQVYDYCGQNDFLSRERHAEFLAALMAEGNEQTLGFATDSFMDGTCPKCAEAGAFKRRFLGRLTHRPGCGQSWYITPLAYMGVQLAACFRMAAEMGASGSAEDEKRGKNGCLSMVFGILFGLLLRLPFAILMIPIQTVVYFAQKKPEGAAGPTP